jgi:hypothetical protein
VPIRLNPASIVVRATLAILALSSVAHARERTRLVVTRDRNAAECPDERALRDAVGARLGYEPFAPGAPSLIIVAFRREGETLFGTVQLRDAAGQVKGERTHSSVRGDCEELASTTALTISILLDPRAGMIPQGKPEPEPNPEPKPQPQPPPERQPVGWWLTAAVTGALGIAPTPTVGLLVGAGLADRWWSASAEFRADLPASRVIGSQEARTSFTGGNLVPCAHIGGGYACAVLSLGAIRGEVVGSSPSSHSTFHLMIGPRVGLSIPLARWLSLDGHVEASLAPTRTTLRVAGDDLWATSTMSGLVGIGLLGRFP